MNIFIGRESQAKRMVQVNWNDPVGRVWHNSMFAGIFCALQWSRVRPFTYFLFFEGPLSTPCNPWWQSLFWTPRSLQLTGRSFVASGPAITANQVHKSSFAGAAAWPGGMSIESPVRGWPSFLQWLAGAQPATSARAARGHIGAALALPAAGLVAAGRWQRKGRRQPGELKLQTMGRLPRIVIKLILNPLSSFHAC